MKYAIVAAALVGLASAQSATPEVTTPPSLVECQPAQITVSGGAAPYTLSIIPGGQTGSAALETLPTVTAAGTVTWDVDIASGTSVTIQVRDANGALNYSQQVTIQAGTSTSCVGRNSLSSAGSATLSSVNTSGASTTLPSSAVVTSASSSAPASSSSGGSSSAPVSSSSRVSSSATSSAPASSTTTTSSAPSSATSGAANGLVAQTGLLGGFAAIVMALVA